MPAKSAASLANILNDLEDIEAAGEDATLYLGPKISLHVSHLNKVFFPDAGATKGDMMRYYAWVSPYLLPLMQDRPLALRRFPNGIKGTPFFQQKAPRETPASVRVQTVSNESGEEQRRLIGGSLITLLYCVQLGTIEVNPWNARVQSLKNPDYTVLDLDPGPSVPFERVVEAALWIKEALDSHDLHAAVKTSGSRGIHIFIPLASKIQEGEAEHISKKIAMAVAKAHPKETTIQRPIRARGGTKVYLDYGQNALGKTVASAYSVRPKPGATVSTPLSWDELTPELDLHAFTIKTLPDRINAMGDIWAPTIRILNKRTVVTKV